MGVYLPTAAVGNGRVLCTIGGSGEIMTFFYPHIDFAQNVRQLMPALYVGSEGCGRVLWAFDAEFERSQRYLSQARVLETDLRLSSDGVVLRFTDFCPPDSTALVRRVRVECQGSRPFEGLFMQYYELRLYEVTGKQSVRYMPEEGALLQYFRDIAVAIGGERPTDWRCGKSIDEGFRSAKSDVVNGHLNGQPEDIGQVDFALGWRLYVEPGQSTEFDIIMVAEPTRQEAIKTVGTLSRAGGRRLEEQTVEQDRLWLGGLKRPDVAPRFTDAYDRALLTLHMLQDRDTSAVIAAPEFDPSYELCGGYGYCWPRDATEAMVALAMAGEPLGMGRLADWYLKAQLPSGQWGQRYWSDGNMASSWSLREDFMQVDQTAAALIAICDDVMSRPEEEAEARAASRWDAVERGAGALAAMVRQDGWHSAACDLWETFSGTFVYTNAGIYRALQDCSAVARLTGHADIAAQWAALCELMKAATLSIHTGGYFPRGMLGHGEPDMAADSSTLGISEPYCMISPAVPEERRLIETNLEFIRQRLTYTMHDGSEGLLRYEGEGYLGGVIGCVNTLWYALVCLQVANSYRGEDDGRAAELRQLAEGYIHFCLDHATPTGLLPELIGTRPDYPYWAAPHSWASGLMVKCILELDRLGRP